MYIIAISKVRPASSLFFLAPDARARDPHFSGQQQALVTTIGPVRITSRSGR